MRIVTVFLIAAAFTSSALAAEDATETVSATTAVNDAVAAVPLRDPKVASDTESLLSDVHGSVTFMVGSGGSYGVGGTVSGTVDDKFHFSFSGSKSQLPGQARDVYRPYGPPGPQALPQD